MPDSLLLTSSEMSQWLKCQRGWWLTYHRKLRRKNDYSSLPTVGNLVHDGLQRYYEGKLERPSDLVAQKASLLLAEHPELEVQISKDAELATVMLDGYLEWVAEEGVDSDLEFVAAEQTVEVQVGPYRLRGKIDARFRRKYDGALVMLEHKTCGNLSDHPVWAQSNPQVLSYDMLAMMTKPEGVRTEGVIINMLRRVKRTPRAHPPFYGRHWVPHNPDELRSHYKHVVGIGRQIENARAQLDAGADHHYVTVPNFNRNHSWSCACFGLDTLPDDGGDLEGYLEDFYEPYNPNERYDDDDS
jgi:PD-(D/E)XK nuclease superfamily